MAVTRCAVVAAAVAGVLGGCAPQVAWRGSMASVATAATMDNRQVISPSQGVPLGPLTLAVLQDYAAEHAPRLVVAQAQLRGVQGQARAAEQRTPYNPVLAVSFGSRLVGGDSGLQTQVAVRQRLQVGGQRRRTIAAARGASAMAQAERDATRWELRVEVRRLFQQAAIVNELLTLTDEAADVARQIVDATAERVAVGDEPALSLDLARAQAGLIGARSWAVAAEHEATLGQLAAAVGWRRDAPLVLAPSRRLRVALPDDAALARLAMTHSPQRAALHAAVVQADAATRVAARKAWPDPTLGASYTHEPGVAGDGAANIVVGTIGLPIPALARNQGGRARARAQVQVSEARVLAFDRGIVGRVHESAARARGALQRMAALGELAAARDGRRVHAFRDAYEAGEIGIVPILRALQQTIETRTALLAAEADYVNALAGLEHVVGAPLGAEGSAR